MLFDNGNVINSITIDVEDWFHNRSAQKVFSKEDWSTLPSVAEEGTKKILNILSQYNVRATFFILGWLGRNNPKLCEIIKNNNHEISSHGFYHDIVYKQSKDEFTDNICASIEVIKKYTGISPIGYRAPCASINKNSMWVFDVLKKLGLKYDSSIYPTKYLVLSGISDIPRVPFEIVPGFIEVPLTAKKVCIIDLPLSGGFYLRTYPYLLYKKIIKKLNRDGIPVVIYIHPWEFTNNFPRIINNKFYQWAQIYNIDTMETKLKMLLSEFKFGTITDLLSGYSKHLL